MRQTQGRGPAFAAGIGVQETAFLQFQQRHHVQELVFFDETAAVERKMRRRKGWGVVGDETHTYVPQILQRDVRFTLAATMTVDGRGLAGVVPGSLDRSNFLVFIEHVLAGMNPHWDVCGARTMLPKSVLVLDNCSTHRCEEFYALARRYRVKLSFTPPYMPWFQPIENAFSVHKRIMKRHSAHFFHNQVLTAEMFILQCWEHVGQEDPDMWRNFCRHAGYIVG